MATKRWLGIELEDCLAGLSVWPVGEISISDPDPGALAMVRGWLATGCTVKVVTELANAGPDALISLQQWLWRFKIPRCEIVAGPDADMAELWSRRDGSISITQGGLHDDEVVA